MYKLIVGLLILSGLTFAATSGTTPVTANRITRASGAPSAGTCNTAASVGKVYIRTDAAATFSTFYVCANTASMTYGWELGGGGGGGSGCVPAGTSGQPLTDNGAGGCNSVNSLSISGSISTGVGGSVAGFWQCTQGTAHTADASSSGFQCPASVTTAFMMTLPSAPITGLILSTGTSDPTTLSFVPLGTGVATALGVNASGSGAICLVTGCLMVTSNTATNCSNAASPAVCGSAAAGAVALPTGITSVTLVVNTSSVTANSEIFLQSDDSLTIAATTCNSTLATLVGGLAVTSRTPGTSFTITYNGTIATNPLCVAYRLVN